MPLLSFWASNPEAVSQMSIEQIVSSAGDGALKDKSICSDELRTYLAGVPSEALGRYIDQCLSGSFQKSGMVLQDLVNELGRRLDYDVANGLYQGTTNGIGYDGLWRSPEKWAIVAEVKTSDAYRLSLDTLARYRDKLIAAGAISPASSVLIVVGRQDTGELEAQIRGSRHAWDVRLISAEALLKLVLLKENSDAPETGLKIRSLLAPVEYTRLDRMVDVMFSTATDVGVQPEPPSGTVGRGDRNDSRAVPSLRGTTDAASLQATRERIVGAVSKREGVNLVRKSRALYWNAAHEVRVACTVSKRYFGKGGHPYWYAYHPAWDEFLVPAATAYLVLGCMDRDEAYAIPRSVLHSLLDRLHTTSKDGSHYWHLHLREDGQGLSLLLPKASGNLPLHPYALPLG